MATKKKPKGKLPWHSAFFAGIQIEFEKEAEKLTFENEHQLGTDPMRIDVLIIKKHTEERIQKNKGKDHGNLQEDPYRIYGNTGICSCSS